MPSQREVVSALYGAWRLMRFDDAGMNWFDLTISGFWRSFFAAALVAPFYAVWEIVEHVHRAEPVDPGWAGIVSILTFAADWVAFPIVAILLTKLLGLTRGYVPLIVASNWANVPQVLIFLTPILIGLLVPFLALIAQVAAFAAFFYVIFYQWFIVRAALQTSGMVAAGVVLVQFMTGIFVQLAGQSLL